MRKGTAGLRGIQAGKKEYRSQKAYPFTFICFSGNLSSRLIYSCNLIALHLTRNFDEWVAVFLYTYQL